MNRYHCDECDKVLGKEITRFIHGYNEKYIVHDQPYADERDLDMYALQVIYRMSFFCNDECFKKWLFKKFFVNKVL